MQFSLFTTRATELIRTGVCTGLQCRCRDALRGQGCGSYWTTSTCWTAEVGVVAMGPVTSEAFLLFSQHSCCFSRVCVARVFVFDEFV